MSIESSWRAICRVGLILVGALCLWAGSSEVAWAQADPGASAATRLGLRELFHAGGLIGIIILALSVAMVALIVEHLFSIRRNALMPPGLAADVHDLIQKGRFKTANELCHENPSYLAHMLSAGLMEVGMGYGACEKAMEDASTVQAARLLRKIEYLSVIGTIAPMLGLLGTVWGMILAFMEFEMKANPQVSELAPGIYKALVTTLEGLSVAIPVLASFAFFRNRIDELAAETSLMAEHVFADFKRSPAAERTGKKARQHADNQGSAESPPSNIPPVAIERERQG